MRARALCPCSFGIWFAFVFGLAFLCRTPIYLQLVHGIEKAYEMDASAPTESDDDPVEELMRELPSLASGVHSLRALDPVASGV